MGIGGEKLASRVFGIAQSLGKVVVVGCMSFSFRFFSTINCMGPN